MSGIIETIEVVDVKDIEPMPVRIRKMKPEEKALLYRSILELGYVEPIQVCKYTAPTDLVDRAPPFYLIVNGQHRFDVLAGELKVDKVTVVILGENWSREKYWSEAIRLNNIHGDYDIIRLAEKIKEVQAQIPDWGMLRERLGFTPTDAIFEKVLRIVHGMNKENAKKLKEKIEKGEVSIEDLTKILRETLSGLSSRKLIVLSLRGVKLMVFECDDEVWAKLMREKEKIGAEALWEKFRDWVLGMGN
jgi:hypothetical protein